MHNTRAHFRSHDIDTLDNTSRYHKSCSAWDTALSIYFVVIFDWIELWHFQTSQLCRWFYEFLWKCVMLLSISQELLRMIEMFCSWFLLNFRLHKYWWMLLSWNFLIICMFRSKEKFSFEKTRRMTKFSKINHEHQRCNFDLCCKKAAIISMNKEDEERNYWCHLIW